MRWADEETGKVGRGTARAPRGQRQRRGRSLVVLAVPVGGGMRISVPECARPHWIAHRGLGVTRSDSSDGRSGSRGSMDQLVLWSTGGRRRRGRRGRRRPRW